MKAIKVTSKLSPAARRMLNYAAKKNVDSLAFTSVGRNLYVQMHGAGGAVSTHAVARRMMVCAHTTFDYELVDLDTSKFRADFIEAIRWADFIEAIR